MTEQTSSADVAAASNVVTYRFPVYVEVRLVATPTDVVAAAVDQTLEALADSLRSTTRTA